MLGLDIGWEHLLYNDGGNDIFSWAWVGNRFDTEHIGGGRRHGNAITGIDGCIYWPPVGANPRTLQHDPHDVDHTILVGNDFGDADNKYYEGVLASDGVIIYCAPSTSG